MENPDWLAEEFSYAIARLREVLRNPRATDEEKRIAESQLKTLMERVYADDKISG